MKKRILFMGTPEFSVHLLEALSSLEVEVIAVVSQPDRKVGRKQVLTPTPVKLKALEKNYPVLQPEKIKDAYLDILTLNPDLILTCAYGQFIPQQILDIPRFGCVNVHASLLPKYRGGAPIHMAVMNGEKESGVTLMRMVKKMDAGDILFQSAITLDENETMGSLHDRLAVCGAHLLIKHFEDLFNPELKSIPQDETLVTFSPNIPPELEFVAFNRESSTVANHIKGLSPWPLAYGVLLGKKVKFYMASPMKYEGNEVPGTVLGLIHQQLAIKTLDGCVLIPELQVEGKSRMSAKDLWLGQANVWLHQRFEEQL